MLRKGLVILTGVIIIFGPSSYYCPDISISQGCTSFYASQGNFALFGRNMDWIPGLSVPESYVWFLPPDSGKCGRIYFLPQGSGTAGGMNDRGLCYSHHAVSLIEPSPSDKPRYEGGDLLHKVMEECATVEEALALLDQYYLRLPASQVLIADRYGNSAIVERDTTIQKQGYFQAVTNFRQSNTGGYSCWRYETAVNMLENSYQPTVGLFRAILNAVHQITTIYSFIDDVINNRVYLFRMSNFEEMVVFDMDEEFSQGEHMYTIRSLFSENSPHYKVTPLHFRLSQNYPNPFNTETTIQFDLPHPSEVTITIYDVKGRLVKTLSNHQRRRAGTHFVIWDGKDDHGNTVSSAEYIYMLKGEGFRETKKMVLLR